MDEIFGFFPPSVNPPSKTPMLTLLKQARAYGLGVVVATQNPVDLDYKGLSNTGTWWLGRLQTERDKARVLDGLEGAGASSGRPFDRGAMETTLSGLDRRVFIMNSVHDGGPVKFQTRWALSYLRGPLTRAQIRRLTEGSAPPPVEPARPPGTPVAPAAGGRSTAERPLLPAEIPQFFIEPDAGAVDDAMPLYRPALLGTAQLHYVRASDDIDLWRTISLLAPLPDRVTANVWSEAVVLERGEPPLAASGRDGARFGELPAAASRPKSFAVWGRSLAATLHRERKLSIRRCPALKSSSGPGETEAEFRIRLARLAREARDAAMTKLERRYAPKLARLRERIRRAEERIGRERSQYDQQKVQTAISIGATVLGALFGRKAASVGTVGRASTAMRGVGRASREKGDVARAADALEAERAALAELDNEFRRDADAVRAGIDPLRIELERVEIAPRKSDITIDRLALVWKPERSRGLR
ncbi:MAG TPA: hypothetical protein VD788_02185, partial [Candidatus Polarisedimenticolaceae bacterium]|nr:hypothetical protein [Candidatus Polarisedimenticolaceae bacterium]